MLAVAIAAAHWIIRSLAVPSATLIRLGMGCVALTLMLLAEFTFVLWLRGLSIRQYFATRDPIAGTVYYITLGAFAVMPLLPGRRTS